MMKNYAKQSGGQLPVFHGERTQRGHVLGSILGGLFRRVLPLLKSGAQQLRKRALKTGTELANDLLDRRFVRESAKHRLPEGITKTMLLRLASSLGLVAESRHHRQVKKWNKKSKTRSERFLVF